MARLNIEAERARLGMTKEQLSKRLSISSKTYLAYIRQKPIPSNVLIRMAELFGCTTDYLLEEQESSPAQCAG